MDWGCVTLCPFFFCNHFDGKERAGCFALFVSLVSGDCCVALSNDATGLSAVCDVIFPDHTHIFLVQILGKYLNWIILIFLVFLKVILKKVSS